MADFTPAGNDGRPMRHSSSYEVLPPNLSELRVVLLGNSWSERRNVGNFILNKTGFDTKGEPGCCLRATRQLKDKEILLINTPDELLSKISLNKLTEHVKTCVRLCSPGPHVFLLVLQPEDFTEDHKLILYRVLESFSERAFNHSLILISTPREQRSAVRENYMKHPPLKDLIWKCRDRYLKQEGLDRLELLTLLSQIVKENKGEPVICDVFEDEDAAQEVTGLTMRPKSEHTKPALNLVLFGRRGATKTSAAKAILGETELHSMSSECVKHQAEVCGRRVSLVELPSLYGKTQEAVMEESFSCVSLCDPEGVHAFVLVLPVGPLTDEDKEELETIQNTFSCRINDFTIILFIVESDPTALEVGNFLRENEEFQQLCQRCGGRYFVLNIKDKQQVSELLDAIQKTGSAGSRCFPMEMFTRALMEKVSRLKAEKPECLRMVLVGRTGSGKSATGNTILGKEHFKSTPILKLKSNSCQKATGEIDGQPVVMVDTPGLFNTALTSEEELESFISMLSPGPHVIFLVLQIGNITKTDKDIMEKIQQHFGKNSQDFTIVIFTGGDNLENQLVDSYIKECDDFVQKLIEACGGRYHIINNVDQRNHRQVTELLTKARVLMKKNGGGYYNTEKFHNIQKDMEKISKEKEEEVQRNEELKRKIQEMRKKINEQTATIEQERKLKDKLFNEKEEFKNEREDRKREREQREEDEKKRKRQEESQRQEWKRKLEALEKKVKSANEAKEKAERKLDQAAKEMRREREDWEKERKEWWDQRHQEDQRSLTEEQTKCKRLQEEFRYRMRKWMGSVLVLVVFLLLSCFYIFMLISEARRDDNTPITHT